MSDEITRPCPNCGRGLKKEQVTIECSKLEVPQFCHFCAHPEGVKTRLKYCPFCGNQAYDTDHKQYKG